MNNERAVIVQRLNSYRNTSEEGIAPGVIKYRGGRYYSIPEFDVEDVDIDSIAMSLAKQPRYNGHTGTMDSPNNGHYSIAQHCVKMAEACLIVYGDPDLAMQCLIHDAGETYMGDIVHPLKVMMGEDVKKLEDKIDRTIARALGVSYPFDDRVKMMDVNICDYEMSVMLDMSSKSYGYKDYWSVVQAYDNWKNMFYQLVDLMKLKDKPNLTVEFSHKGKCQ